MKKSFSLISIIMPAFNAERYIAKSIESILNQSSQNYELIIVENNSTDQTWEIVSEYALRNKNIKSVQCFKQGVSYARNYGIDVAQGEYICFLDSDDLYDVNVIEERTKFILENDAPVTTCNITFLNCNDDVIGELKAKNLIFEDFHDCLVHTNSVMFRQDIIKKVKFDTEVHNGEDWLTWSRVARMGYQYKAIKTCSVSYVHHHATVYDNFLKHTMGLLNVIDILYSEDKNFLHTIPKYRYGLQNPRKDEIKRNRLVVAYIYYAKSDNTQHCVDIGKLLLNSFKMSMSDEEIHKLMVLSSKKYYLVKDNQEIFDKILESRTKCEKYLHVIFQKSQLDKFYVDLEESMRFENMKNKLNNKVFLNTLVNIFLPLQSKRRRVSKHFINRYLRSKEQRISIVNDALSKITEEDKKGIQRFENKFYGERCFIIGNGPSLNKCDLKLLKNEYTFGVNGIFYKTEDMGFCPTFYMVEDSHVIDDNLSKINDYTPMHKFFPSLYREKIVKTDSTHFFASDLGFYRSGHPFFEKPRFSKDFSKVGYCGQSVTYLNMQLAYYMGFTEVYLIGMDFSYTVRKTDEVQGLTLISNEDDINHFHSNYFGKGKKWHDPKIYNVAKSYEFAKEIFEEAGRNIYNATVGGSLEIFERVDYEKLF